MAGCNRDWFDNISAWHDGEVTLEDAARIEAHIADCRECQGAVTMLGGVRRALVAKADGNVPQRVRERAESVVLKVRAPSRPRWAIAATLAVAAAGIVLLTGAPNRGVSAALADDLVTHHLSGFARERPCDFESSDPSAVSAWLEQGLGYAVTVPEMSGARLLGARLCRLGGTRTAALMYMGVDKPITVFVPPSQSGPAVAARTLAGEGVGCTKGPLGNAICARNASQPMLAVADEDTTALAPALGGR